MALEQLSAALRQSEGKAQQAAGGAPGPEACASSQRRFELLRADCLLARDNLARAIDQSQQRRREAEEASSARRLEREFREEQPERGDH